MIAVRAYDRTREGRREHVGAHSRSSPERDAAEADPATGGPRSAIAPSSPRATPVAWYGGIDPNTELRLPLGARPSPIGPPIGGGSRPPPLAILPRRSLLAPYEGATQPRRGTLRPRWPAQAMQNAMPDEAGEGDGAEGGAAGTSAPPAATTGTAALPGLRPSPDTVEGLRSASRPSGEKTRTGLVVENWDTDADEDQMAADLEALRPGPMEVIGDGRLRGFLPDGRQVVTRPSSAKSDRRPTLEISVPDGVSPAGRPRFKATDKFLYRPRRQGP